MTKWELALLWFHGLCLDAPCVACTWSLVFTGLTGLPLRWRDVCILFMTVWLGYVLDRSLDVSRYSNQQQLSFRHQLIKRYHKVLMLIGVFCCAIAGFLFLQDFEINPLVYGSVGLILASIYSLWVYYSPAIARRILPRELAVAVFFTLATVILPVSRSLDMLEPVITVVYCVLLIICCWMNLCSISLWEAALDANQAEVSIVQSLGLKKNFSLFNYIICAALIVGLMNFDERIFSLGCCGLVMITATHLLSYLVLQPETKSTLADIIMLLPSAMLWCEW